MVLRRALILDVGLEEMAEQIGIPLASKGMMLRQSSGRSWRRGRAFLKGYSFCGVVVLMRTGS